MNRRKVKTKYGEFTFLTRTIRLWNQLAKELRATQSCDLLKMYAKKYLLNKQRETIKNKNVCMILLSLILKIFSVLLLKIVMGGSSWPERKRYF